jgi:hypothetical protein
MGEVCASVSAALKESPENLPECVNMMDQAAQCAEIFKRGMKDEEAGRNDDGPRDVPGVGGREEGQEDRPEKEDEEKEGL